MYHPVGGGSAAREVRADLAFVGGGQNVSVIHVEGYQALYEHGPYVFSSLLRENIRTPEAGMHTPNE